MPRNSLFGFTLVELLISLLIIGEIATFTIPKIVSSQQNGTRKTAAKEAISMVSAAYSLYRANNSISSATRFADLTPYMNYVKLDTTGAAFSGTWTCTASNPCVRLHSGATLLYWDFENFGGTATTNAFLYVFDPGGNSDSNVDELDLFLFYNGRVTEQAGIPASTAASCCNSFGWTGNPAYTPTWFSW